MGCVLLKAFCEYTALKQEKIKVRKYLKQPGKIPQPDAVQVLSSQITLLSVCTNSGHTRELKL